MNTSVRLENKTAGHNKFYEFLGFQTKDRFTIKGLFGAIGQAPKEVVIYDGESKVEAEKEYQKKLSEKQKKGYTVVSRNGKVASAATEEKKTLLTFQ
jgi:hypothetical protein